LTQTKDQTVNIQARGCNWFYHGYYSNHNSKQHYASFGISTVLTVLWEWRRLACSIQN